MTDAEQIDLLRREVADLRERLARLEARPLVPVPPVTLPHPIVQPSPGMPGSWPAWMPPPIVTCQLSPEPTGAMLWNGTSACNAANGSVLGSSN